MTRLHQLWLVLNSSLWFLPALMVTGTIALAVGSSRNHEANP